MTCYEIARKIRDKVRVTKGYCMGMHTLVNGVTFYDSSDSYEYFVIHRSGVNVRIMKGDIYKIEMDNPRGIILFNLRLWLSEVDKIVK